MSTSALKAQGSTLHIAGTAAAAEVITAITLGYPTILAITGHAGVANGDVITLAGFTGADAATLNAQTATVRNYATGATDDTFAIDINTVGKTITVDAGNSTVTPTAWIKVGNLKTIKPSGASLDELEVTDLDSTAKEMVSGTLPDYGTVSLDNFTVDSDVGQAAMLAAYNAKLTKSFKITYPSGATPIRTFSAFVKKFPDIGDIGMNGIITGSVELRRTSAVVVS